MIRETSDKKQTTWEEESAKRNVATSGVCDSDVHKRLQRSRPHDCDGQVQLADDPAVQLGDVVRKDDSRKDLQALDAICVRTHQAEMHWVRLVLTSRRHLN